MSSSLAPFCSLIWQHIWRYIVQKRTPFLQIFSKSHLVFEKMCADIVYSSLIVNKLKHSCVVYNSCNFSSLILNKHSCVVYNSCNFSKSLWKFFSIASTIGTFPHRKIDWDKLGSHRDKLSRWDILILVGNSGICVPLYMPIPVGTQSQLVVSHFTRVPVLTECH
jgi:hypothetical protein